MLFKIIKIVITLILVAVLLNKTDFPELFIHLKNLSFFTFPIACLFVSLGYSINALKWRLLLPNYSYRTLLRLNIIGTYYSMVLPGQLLGEFIKAYKLGKGTPRAEMVASSVIIDKITALLALLITGIFGLLSTSLPSTHGLFLALVGSFLSLMIFLIFAKQLMLPVSFIFKSLSKKYYKLQKLHYQWQEVFQSWSDHLKKPKRLIYSVLLGIVFQLISVITVMFLAKNLNIEIAFSDWCWIFTGISLSLLLPLSIAGIGIREGAFIGLLKIFHVPLEKALALSLCIFSLNLLTALVGWVLEIRDDIKK